MNLTKLVIKQNRDSTFYETFENNTTLISKIYETVVNCNNATITGNISVKGGYVQDIEYLNDRFKTTSFNILYNYNYVRFEDPNFEQFLLSKGVGGEGATALTVDNLNSITDILTMFYDRSQTQSTYSFIKMNEFKYFTNINYRYFNSLCYLNSSSTKKILFPNLQEVTLPYNYNPVGDDNSNYMYSNPLFLLFGEGNKDKFKNIIIKYDYKENVEIKGDVYFYSNYNSPILNYNLRNTQSSGYCQSEYLNKTYYLDGCFYASIFTNSNSYNNVVQGIIYPDYIVNIYDNFNYITSLRFIVFPTFLRQLNLVGSFRNLSFSTIDLVFKSAWPPKIISTFIYNNRQRYNRILPIEEMENSDPNYASGLQHGNQITYNVYAPDNCIQLYNNMIPFKFSSETNNTQINFNLQKWHLYPLSQLSAEKKLEYGITQEDIDREPLEIIEEEPVE